MTQPVKQYTIRLGLVDNHFNTLKGNPIKYFVVNDESKHPKQSLRGKAKGFAGIIASLKAAAMVELEK